MNPACIQAEFARAEKAARAARLLCESDLPEDAVSRSYYAVLHAAKAALLAHEVIAESHAAIRRLFGKILVKPGIFEAKWAAIFRTNRTDGLPPITMSRSLGNPGKSSA